MRAREISLRAIIFTMVCAYITIHRLRTNGQTFACKSPKYLVIYVPDPRDRGNCVRIPRRRRVGCFLLPVVSVIRSLLFTNESRGLDEIVNLYVQRKDVARHAARIKTTVFISVLSPPRGTSLFF